MPQPLFADAVADAMDSVDHGLFQRIHLQPPLVGDLQLQIGQRLAMAVSIAAGFLAQQIQRSR